MKKRIILLWLSSLLIVVAITAVLAYLVLKPDFSLQKEHKAAFSISFDDNSIKDWYDARPLFDKYGVKATFFITLPQELSSEDKRMLAALAADGHEIASHAYAHQNARQAVEDEGIDNYLSTEIVPSIQELSQLGYQPITFAYPYGARTRPIDFELKKYFYLLRGDSWKVAGKGIDELDRIFYTYDGDKVVNGLGIDNGSNISVEELREGFKRAKKQKEAIVIYAHSINRSNDKYSITPERLESILAAAREEGLVSLRFKDLVL